MKHFKQVTLALSMMLTLTSVASAQTAKSVSIELSSIETTLNLCVVDALKKLFPVDADTKVVDSGFAFAGTFPTHPLFNDVPVLFVSYYKNLDQNEVEIVKDLHVAIPSLQRSGWTADYANAGASVSGFIDGTAYVSVLGADNTFGTSPIKFDVSSCF